MIVEPGTNVIKVITYMFYIIEKFSKTKEYVDLTIFGNKFVNFFIYLYSYIDPKHFNDNMLFTTIDINCFLTVWTEKKMHSRGSLGD